MTLKQLAWMLWAMLTAIGTYGFIERSLNERWDCLR
jgi:hypothetical protein